MRLIQFVDVLKNNAIRNCRKYSSIEIPKKAKRDNLSILKALSSVTKPDYLAPHYHYIDDPFLIPMNGADKKEFSMSFVSGKEAARDIMAKHPHFFLNSTAHPLIKNFMPQIASLPLESVNGLKERIEMKLAIESYDSYRKLYDEGVEIDRPLLDDLLDLLCFTNHEAPTNPIDIIEHYTIGEMVKFGNQGFDSSSPQDSSHQIDSNNEAITKTHWKANGPAERLFSEIKNPSSRNICSLIKGMTKFGDYASSYDHYQKGIEQNLDFDVATYNAALKSISLLNINPNETWDKVIAILERMDSKGVAPNINTFNEVLSILYERERSIDNSHHILKMILNEINTCELEPTLTTWWIVSRFFYFIPQERNRVLRCIIEELNESNINIQGPHDVQFFPHAMGVCKRTEKNTEVAQMLNNIIVNNGFDNILSNNSIATSYYSNYMVIMAKYAPVDEFFSEYYRLVPHSYSPTFRVFESILDMVDACYCYEHIPKIWSDMVMLRMSKRDVLLVKMLQLMIKAKENDKHSDYYVEIVDHILKQYLEGVTLGLARNTELTGELLSNMLSVYLNSEEIDKCWNLLKVWKESPDSNVHYPGEESLQRLCQVHIQKDEYEKMIEVYKIIASFDYYCIGELMEEAFDKMTLSDSQK